MVWAATYLPFGQATTTGSITQDLRLPGQIADANTGLYQNFHRDYIPWLGRYLETDPLGLAAGVNTYAYAGQNPLRNVDPSGLQVVPEEDDPEEEANEAELAQSWREYYSQQEDAFNRIKEEAQTMSIRFVEVVSIFKRPTNRTGHEDRKDK